MPAAISQATSGRSLPGPDAQDLPQGLNGHLTGDWGGARTKLKERGVNFGFEYITDSLWNINSDKRERLASWNRGRGTVDIDFDALAHQHGLFLHVTALWQAGGNLQTYLGTETSPSGLSSITLFRLDSWWVEKQWCHDRVAVRIGQFAGEDFYGNQEYGTSFILEPMGYALDNLLPTTFETSSPSPTPALELTVAPVHNVYVASMVLAGDRLSFFHNPTGLVPQFRGAPVSVSEIGFTPGKKTLAMRPADDVASRKGYSGAYKFGASFNPGKFTTPTGRNRSGDYLMYWIASQALWRVDPKEGRGLDATAAYDWSPADVNSNNRELTAGLRFNEPLPLRIHNTLSIGYVRDKLNPLFRPNGMAPYKAEEGLEINSAFSVQPMILIQPVFQYFANVGGGEKRAVVLGFRARVEF